MEPTEAQVVTPPGPSSLNQTVSEFLRYAVVGGIAFVAEFVTLYILAERLHVYYQIAGAVAFTVGLTVNYVLSVTWVFTQRTLNNRMAEFLIFAIIGVLGMGINALILGLFTGRLKFNVMLSKCVAAAVILLWNYGARKVVLFRRAQREAVPL